jgi:hypothetical protein
MGTGSFLGVKWQGRSVNHPPPSSAEVKERVELYLSSPFGPSWSVLVWNLLLLPDVSKYCLLSEKPVPGWNNPQQIVGSYMIGGPEQWDDLRCGLCKDLILSTVQDITYPWQSVYSDNYVFSISEWSGQATDLLWAWNRYPPCSNRYDANVCPRFHPLDN